MSSKKEKPAKASPKGGAPKGDAPAADAHDGAAAKDAKGDAPAKRGGPPVALIGMAVVAALGGGAGAYILTPAKAPSAHGEKAEAGKEKPHKPAADKGHGEKKAHGEKKSKSEGDSAAADSGADHFEVKGEIGYYAMPNFVVSIRPGGAARHLKLSLAIETTVDSEAAFLDRSLRIRDALNSYLRAVDPSVVEDPAAMARLRAQIKRRIEFAAAPAPVHAVLITEFILS
jgi:flagellar FliL protein